MKILINNGRVMIKGSTILGKNDEPAPPPIIPTYALRDVGPAGGLICYINPNYIADGWKYLEASQVSGGQYEWSDVETLLGTTSSDVGEGLDNTSKILGQSGYDSANSGASICNEWVERTFDDWFLPSLDELEIMYDELHAHGVGNFPTTTSYWSSTESDAGNSFRFSFGSNYSNARGKDTHYFARPLRRFTYIDTYRITYNGNENTAGSVPSDTTYYNRGSDVTIAAGTGLINNTDAFIGWNTRSDGFGTDYSASSTLVIGENTTLYAKYASATIAFLPDTQSYVHYSEEVMTDQINYLVSNKSSLNLAFVGHEGDVVQDSSDSSEWVFARTEMTKLGTASIPYSVLPGNHDYLAAGVRTNTTFNSYFPLSVFQGMATYEGAYNTDSDNTYHIVSINENDLLVISLEFGARGAVLTWANGILAANSTIPAIIITHAYIGINGEPLESDDNHAPSNGYGLGTVPADVNDGSDIWTTLVYPNNNVKLVMSGHDGSPSVGAKLKTSTHADGSTVYQLLSNYQYYGDYPGYLTLFRFNSSKVYFRTYSPTLEEFKEDDQSQGEWSWTW